MVVVEVWKLVAVVEVHYAVAVADGCLEVPSVVGTAPYEIVVTVADAAVEAPEELKWLAGKGEVASIKEELDLLFHIP